MIKLVSIIRRSLLLWTLLFSLAVPQVIQAESLSSHATITMSTTPDQPVAGEETRFNIVLKDKAQQPLANAPVVVRAEMATSSMPGMNHGSSGPSANAKPSDKPGEYLASLKLTDPGDWKITVTTGDSAAQFKLTAILPSARNTSQTNSAQPQTKPATSAPAWLKVASGPVQASSMEAVHASYLELAGNIADLRSRVDQWKKGDQDSLKIGEEKLERIQATLGAVTWPGLMAKAVITTTNPIAPMAKAFKDKDVAAAEAAAKAFGDGSHDVTHAFYGDWLSSLGGIRFSPMAPHAIYLDLSANIADLRDRVAQWQKGDESSLNIAKEKVERIDILLPHLSPSGMLQKPATAIEKALPSLTRALEKKDLAAAQQALKPIADASHDLTHDFYGWVAVSAGGTDIACVLASYRDLTLNIADLRARVTQWQAGDEDSYKIALEKQERLELVLGHPTWPAVMAPAIGKTVAAAQAMSKALPTKDLGAADAASKLFGDASHDVTHAYYGDWLPATQFGPAEGQIVAGQGQTVNGGHGHEGEAGDSTGPNYYFVGSVLGVVLITIVLVPILRRRDLRVVNAEAD